MVKVVPNEPITTDTPTLVVDAGLRPGKHRFRLVVVDDEGNASAPDEQVVTIIDDPFSRGFPPTAERITPLPPRARRAPSRRRRTG